MMDLLGVSTRINLHLAAISGILKGFNDAQSAKRRDRDGAEGGDPNGAPVPQDRHARAAGIAQGHIPMTPSYTTEQERLRAALVTISELDHPRPVGKSWFPDGRPSKHDTCTHGEWMYESCDNCIAEFAAAVLSITPESE